MVMGRERPASGLVELGEHGIVPNYFEQNQAEAMDPTLTVLETLVRTAPDAKVSELKSLLGRMLFGGDSMDKKVGGGGRVRGGGALAVGQRAEG
jgi:ATP-binding cassette subfamily F protein 3